MTGCAPRARNLDAATRVFKLVEERFNVGTASALDTAQQESLVNTVRAALPLLEQQLRREHRHARGADRPRRPRTSRFASPAWARSPFRR